MQPLQENDFETREKQWQSLNIFKQTHRGRLDTGNGASEKSSDEHSESDSTRSQSEMSNIVPQYVYRNIQRVTEREGSRTKISRHYMFSEFVGATDNKVSSKISEYKQNVDKENRLRQDIIKDLLLENDLGLNPDHQFIIPELPTGSTLYMEIFSTWGDRNYVGLNGIQIFGLDGCIVPVEKKSIARWTSFVFWKEFNSENVCIGKFLLFGIGYCITAAFILSYII